jgi:hypothetical protein
MTPLDAALKYSARLPVFPVGANKRPLVAGGFHAATKDEAKIRHWWALWPDARISTPTGVETGLVILDIDVKNEVNGHDALQELGVLPLPHTPIAHTPSGGVHVYFDTFFQDVPTSIGKIGKGLDVKGERASITLPTPGSGYWWDPHANFKTVELAPAPEWLIPPPPPKPASAPTTYRPPPSGEISSYAAAAINSAVRNVFNAGPGEQAITLNRECFGIGQLVGGGHAPEGAAISALMHAALAMPSFDQRRPWRRSEVERSVRASFEDGVRSPR